MRALFTVIPPMIFAVGLSLTLGCGGSFDAKFSGLSGGTSSDENAQPDSAADEPGTFETGSVDQLFAQRFSSERFTVDSKGNECITGLKSGRVDFESYNELDTVATLNESLIADYGIAFENVGDTDLAVARIVGEKDPNPDFRAWKSILCPKLPNHNQLCFGGDGGQRILSSTNALNTKNLSFKITLVKPVNQLSFEFADIDGNEEWSFELFNEKGEKLDAATEIKQSGYGADTGNSALTKFEFIRVNKDIKELVATGTKSIKLFGFGIDNIETGLTICE